MPPPMLPQDARRVVDNVIDGSLVEHWIVNVDNIEQSHIYIDAKLHIPRRLVQEIREDGENFVPIMTYDFLDFELVVPAETVFTLSPPWNDENCSRHIGGWPYIHLFHHYLRV